jgi:hypothetical protein
MKESVKSPKSNKAKQSTQSPTLNRSLTQTLQGLSLLNLESCSQEDLQPVEAFLLTPDMLTSSDGIKTTGGKAFFNISIDTLPQPKDIEKELVSFSDVQSHKQYKKFEGS